MPPALDPTLFSTEKACEAFPCPRVPPNGWFMNCSQRHGVHQLCSWLQLLSSEDLWVSRRSGSGAGRRPTRWGVELPLPETLHWKLQWAGGREGEVGDNGSGAKVQAAALGGMGKGQAPAGPWTGQGEPRQVEGRGGSGVRMQFPSLCHELCLAAGVQKQQHQSGGSPVGAELQRPGQCRDRKFQ